MSDKLDSLMATVQKELKGRALLLRGTDIVWQTRDRLRTGSLGLDIATNGGIPRGMISIFMGEEGSGKTTMALKVAGMVQERFGQDAAIGWVAIEPFDKKWANQCGAVIPLTPEELAAIPQQDRDFFDVEETGAFVVGMATTGEDALELAVRMIQTGAFQLVVVDSIAALSPEVETEGEMSDQTMGQIPRLLGRFIRKCQSALNTRLDGGEANKTAILLINQVRDKIGGYGHPEPEPPGGRGVRHASVLTVRFKRGELLKDEEGGLKRIYGKRTKVRVEKCKVGPPYREAEFDFYFQTCEPFHPGDINREQELRLLGVQAGLIQQTSNVTYEAFGQKFRGKDAVEKWLREHPEDARTVEDQILQVLTTA